MTGISIRLPCAGVGTVFMQFCLSIGTEPFHLLNGTYQTFTVFFPRTCEGSSAFEYMYIHNLSGDFINNNYNNMIYYWVD